MNEKTILERLFENRDEAYAAFSAKLIPNIAPEDIIGVRAPALKALAKELRDSALREQFLLQPEHRYLEENNLHALFLAQIKSFEACVEQTERFLPYVNNWATCDSLRPPCFKKNKQALLGHIENWLHTDRLYTARFGIGMLMCHFLDEDFDPKYLEWVAAVHSEEYYLNMMRAWYFATALAKQYESTLPLFEGKELDRFTHNKAIQKARESFRVSDAHKKELASLRLKRAQ